MRIVCCAIFLMAAVVMSEENAGKTSAPDAAPAEGHSHEHPEKAGSKAASKPAPKNPAQKNPAHKKPAPKAAAPTPKSYLLRQALHAGTTFVGSNTVAFDLKTTVKRNNKETKSRESVERTERFRDRVQTASERGPLKIERMYQKLFTKVRLSGKERPDVDQSPLQGRKVIITERGRVRRVSSVDNLVVPPIVRKSIGVELDWRDILPREPVKVGDKWEADAERLARRIAVYLDSGTRSHMKVTFEGIDDRDGRRCAKLYVDWKIDGMRDRQLFTKARLAGDVLFDLDLQRFVSVDLSGQFAIQGAITGNGTPKIVKGEGTVTYKSTLRQVPVVAAASGE